MTLNIGRRRIIVMKKTKVEYAINILIVAAILLIIGLSIVVPAVKAYTTQRYETFTVNKSERITEGNSSRYLIYTQEGVYENTDVAWLGKFNSSDMYNKIETNKTYNCLVVGWRVQFLSWYPNVIECDSYAELKDK